MKKVLFGIFAHPDDEAFGPSASLYNAAQTGTDVHLVLVTDGESGTNTDNVADLGTVRLEEWKESRKRIGATSGLALHYPDGSLCNNLYLEIAEKILKHITQTLSQYTEPVSVDFITFEHSGISGHLDHVAVSFISTHVFLKLQDATISDVVLGRLKYYCLPESIITKPNNDWIYMPRGKESQDIDETFDYRELAAQKLHIMEAHVSQRSDMEKVIAAHGSANSAGHTTDHFIYFRP